MPAGLFHDFHQSWCVRLKDALNAGRLPRELPRSWNSDPARVSLTSLQSKPGPDGAEWSWVPAAWPPMPPPAVQIVHRSESELYAARANLIVIRHHLGRILAVIEIVSPGNKDTREALHNFVEKTVQFLQAGIHVLVVDLFPPTPRNPQGIHQAIWDEIGDEPFSFPPGKDRLLVSYETGEDRIANIEPLALGDALREMSLCLTSGLHVPVPLESTYQATWDARPEVFRLAVETGTLPEPEGD